VLTFSFYNQPFANNIAFAGGGLLTSISGFTFNSTNFYNNSAINGSGGAIDMFTFSSGYMTFINCNIQQNSAIAGGAMAVEFSNFKFTFQNCIITQNYASNTAGGFYILTDVTNNIGLTLISSTLANNLISTKCVQDIICEGNANINLGLGNNCGNGSNCTLPLVGCFFGCTGDICSCPYSSTSSYCTPLSKCPSGNTPTNINTTAIIAACSSVGAAIIIVGLFFLNRKYKWCTRIRSSYGEFDERKNSM